MTNQSSLQHNFFILLWSMSVVMGRSATGIMSLENDLIPRTVHLLQSWREADHLRLPEEQVEKSIYSYEYNTRMRVK